MDILKNKIKVFLYSTEGMDFSDYERLKSTLPEAIAKKADSKNLLKNKLQTAASYKMLYDFCRFEKNTEPEISVKKGGKPYFENFDICFSISHSNNMALCAVSDGEIGIDIERTDKKRDYLNLAERYFTEAEFNRIKNSEDIKDSFVKIWTCKEAYIKYTGEGFKNGVDYFETEDNHGRMFFKGENMPSLYTVNLEDGYYLSLVYEGEKEVEIINREKL